MNSTQTATGLQNSAWDQARRQGRKVFYEAATSTLRQCPENYLLAVKGQHGWYPAPDKASNIGAHSLSFVLTEHVALDGDALAAAVQDSFWGF
jgi:hypothetical protein